MRSRLTADPFIVAAICSSIACNALSPPSPRDATVRLGHDATVAPTSSSPRPDARAPQLVTYATSPGPLRGFLYRPEGRGPFPAIVYNHGSERLPGTKEGQAEFFVQHGFVLFVPHRRGHGQSAAAGEYFEDAWQREGRRPETLVNLLDAQVDDVVGAVEYVRGLPFVDGSRIAVVGCSFGGIESLLAAERDLGLRAAIDFAGGAIMWSRILPLQERMRRAARAARVPVFFIQAENDFDTTPSRVLSEEMSRLGLPVRVHVFPPNGTTDLDGHSFCVGGERPPWGPDVLTFLAESMTPRDEKPGTSR